MNSEIPLSKISQFKPGQTADCFAQLSSKEKGTTRDGKPYYRTTFRDSEKQVTCMIWQDTPFFDSCELDWKTGEFYKIRCTFEETQYGPQIEIDVIRPVKESDHSDGFHPADFLLSTRFDVEKMFAELMELVDEKIVETPLQKLVTSILTEHEKEFKKMPAASRYHHAYRGGLLEHTLSVTRNAVFFSEKYDNYYPEIHPPLSKSLVVAGAILHDIGKLIELDGHPQGSDYTPQGRLVGHILLGRDLVRDKAKEIDEFNPETLLRLEHIVISHQNLPEWGSPIAPHTPEALLVYYADALDAAYHQIVTPLETEPKEMEQFTDRNNVLRRGIFRGLTSPLISGKESSDADD